MRFTTRRIEPIADPLALDPASVWMSRDVSLWGFGEAHRINPGSGADRFRRLREGFVAFAAEADIEGSGPIMFTSVTFAEGSVGSAGIVPRVLVSRKGDEWSLTSCDGADLPTDRIPPAPDPDRARYAGSSMPDVLWLEAVAEAVRRIEAGAVEKVVLARDYAVWSRVPFHPPRLLSRLHERFPNCYTFRVDNLVGASPELLLRRNGMSLQSLVLAGSAPTFDDPAADSASGRTLMESAKDRWEHQLAVDSVRESVRDLTAHLEVPDEPRLLRLDNVQHLATPVTAKALDDTVTLRLVEALHPTAAVGGTPTDRAVEMIAELEGMDRGRYSGPIGWLDTDDNGEFAIALRCAELSGARARLFAGAGIVTGSLPEAELEETRIKLGAMMGALAT